MELTFVPENLKWKGEPGSTVLEIAAEAGAHIDGNCAGASTCGKCKVRVLSGNTSDPDAEERHKLTERELNAGFRLACRFRPVLDTVIEIPVSDSAVRRKTDILDAREAVRPDHRFRRMIITVSKASLEDQRSDESRIIDACGGDGIRINASLLREIPDLLKKSTTLTATLFDQEIVHIEPEAAVDACYGVSFDIGTTTVVGMLWDLVSGRRIAAIARTNPQGAYGADVISRINYAGQRKENLENIHRRIIICLDAILGELTLKADISREHVYDITVAGNTTMGHLFLGVEPMQLAKAPFAPVFRAAASGYARDIGINAGRLARYYLLPCIAGHVGSDITAGLIATGMLHRSDAHLLLDVGTNGELVLSKAGRAFACSTAAGPAFEGASIHQGMRAAAGAIEAVEIGQEDVHVKTIGHQPAVGICGSGIIDAVAELVRHGIVDKTGKLLDEARLLDKGIKPEIAGRVRKGDNGKEFVLVFGGGQANDIVILQKDIREVQLAKAAISAGIRTMLKEMELEEDEIAGILIAGAFGNYIKIESAVEIGLIPKIDRKRIAYVGNAAGIGASFALLSGEKRREAEKVSDSIHHLELSTYQGFPDEYMKAMMF